MYIFWKTRTTITNTSIKKFISNAKSVNNKSKLEKDVATDENSFKKKNDYLSCDRENFELDLSYKKQNSLYDMIPESLLLQEMKSVELLSVLQKRENNFINWARRRFHKQ